MRSHTQPEGIAPAPPPQWRRQPRAPYRRTVPGIAFRAGMLVAHVIAGTMLALLIRGADLVQLGRWVPRERLAGAWHRTLLGILGIRVTVDGTPMRTPHLIVSNHVSWLDIPVIGAVAQVRFVSRHDVKHWPIAGILADACGTLYLDRGAGRSRFTAESMRARLKSGAVALFPEGTTTDGRQVSPFRARLFQAAIDAGTPVQPLALRYGPGPDGSPIAAFVGDDSLLPHVLRILRSGGLQVDMQVLPTLQADGATGRGALSSRAHQLVEQAVQAMGLRPAPGERYQ